jgi:hypothetical protein
MFESPPLLKNLRTGDYSTELLPFDVDEQRSRIEHAAKLGGVANFVAKFTFKMKTDLDNMGPKYQSYGPPGLA